MIQRKVSEMDFSHIPSVFVALPIVLHGMAILWKGSSEMMTYRKYDEEA